MLKIHNFRAGFATNSSSSHSIVLVPTNKLHMLANAAKPDGFEFSGGDWQLVTPEEKIRYLAVNLVCGYNNDNIIEIMNTLPEDDEFCKIFKDTFTHAKENKSDVYVPYDDQFSLKWVNDSETLQRLIKYMKSDNIIIFGDQAESRDDDYYISWGGEQIIGSKKDRVAEELFSNNEGVRIKNDGKYSVVFDPYSGNKMRFSFENRGKDGETDEYTKSTTPELVDVKITDYCPLGCKFCYQSSTKNGKHASLENLENIFSMLQKLDVFEIAIGGGEPTMHPNFVKILKLARKYNLVPNFTTFSDKWLTNSAIVDGVKRHAGAIGVSCHSAKGLSLVDKIANASIWNQKMAQHVFGSVPIDVTIDFLNTAMAKNYDVLLLGYKDVGFGKNYKRFDDDGAETIMKLTLDNFNNSFSSLSVDTALVDQYRNLIKTLGVPDALITSPEGKFSCYIDAVNNTMAPSSYIPINDMEPLVYDPEQFKEKYAKY